MRHLIIIAPEARDLARLDRAHSLKSRLLSPASDGKQALGIACESLNGGAAEPALRKIPVDNPQPLYQFIRIR